jgi:Zn-dependent metalloprotease
MRTVVEHVRLARTHRGLRVIGGDFVVHGHQSGRLDSVSQELRATLDVATQATLSPDDAAAAAAPEFEGTRAGDARVELVVYARDAAVRLAYDVVLGGVRPDRTPSTLHVFVDAQSGAVIDRWDDIETDGLALAGAAPSCTGDCDGNGGVEINELILGVDIALAEQPLSACPAFDCQGDGSVGIACLVGAVDNALGGCPAAPTATATLALPTPTATPDVATDNARGFFYDPVSLATTFTGSTFALSDTSRGDQRTTDMQNGSDGNGTLFTDPDNLWGDGSLSSRQSVAVDAQYGMAQTWDYYQVAFGRNGIADDGVGAYNRIHYESGYDNAFWSDDCFCMTYGDGDGQTFYPFVALDITGHEMSHGVTSRTAELAYSRESGGLNEATSDIFGTAVEFHADDPNDPPDYLIGEKIYIEGGQALRYMYRPSKDGRSADCWSPSAGLLNVHYSSGVANHFFYLLAEGSGVSAFTDATGATTCDGATLTGIGRDAAAQIWYRALTVYMTSTTTYAGARVATLEATADLFGAGSAEYGAVAAAWSAVNVN